VDRMSTAALADGSKGANTRFATGEDSHQTLRARVAAKRSLDMNEPMRLSRARVAAKRSLDMNEPMRLSPKDIRR